MKENEYQILTQDHCFKKERLSFIIRVRDIEAHSIAAHIDMDSNRLLKSDYCLVRALKRVLPHAESVNVDNMIDGGEDAPKEIDIVYKNPFAIMSGEKFIFRCKIPDLIVDFIDEIDRGILLQAHKTRPHLFEMMIPRVVKNLEEVIYFFVPSNRDKLNTIIEHSGTLRVFYHDVPGFDSAINESEEKPKGIWRKD